MQAVFLYLWLRRKSNFLSNSDECPDALPQRLDGCNLELFEISKHWRASGRMTGPSRRKLGIRLLWLGLCTESSLSILNIFFWNEDSEINGIPNNAANHKTNKSGFETITSNIASTSKTIFVKPEVAESHNACEEKGKAVIIWKIKWLLI